MLNLPIYLYPNVCEVILDLDATVLGVNQIMYQRDLKIQKGVKNTVQIQFKNSDQKRLSILNSGTFVFTMFDITSQRLVLEKPIVILDDSSEVHASVNQSAISNMIFVNSTGDLKVGQSITGYGIKPNSVIVAVTTNTVTLNNFTGVPVTTATVLTVVTPTLKGLGEVNFLEGDTVDLAVSDYSFSVKYLDHDGEFLPAYSNTYYGVNGVIQLASDIYPVLQPSQTITAFLKTLNPSTGLYYYPSGNIYAYPEYNGNSALHTLAIYMTNFKGTVTVQGTLSNQPDSSNWYSTITTLTYDGSLGIDHYSFNGAYTYIKIIYTPAIKPGDSTNDDPNFFGSFDKVLYRS